MGELLELYDLDGNLLGTQNRDEFYKEVREEYARTGKVTRQLKTIRLFLMNSSGRIYIQRRSLEKKENPGLYDKTIGGHVKAGHTWYMTVVQECHEELGFPAVVLSDEEFRMAIKHTDLKIVGLFRQVDYLNQFVSVRKAPDGAFKQPYISTFYVGYYDGSIRFCDGESVGIEVFTIEELEQRIKDSPEHFTEDLKWMVARYRDYLVPLKNDQKPVLGF